MGWLTNDRRSDGELRGHDETRSVPAGETETFGSGRYVVQRPLGEGAQKTVYLVHDTTLGRDCALSLLKTELLQADDLARLRREGQTMARLTHANIVTVYDISDEAEERPYIVSEYVPRRRPPSEAPRGRRPAAAAARDRHREGPLPGP